MRRGLIVLPLVAVLAACAASPPPRPHGPPGGGAAGGGAGRGVFISPMGEPFRGAGGRAALLGTWFAAADTDHDGRLTMVEMKADAARFFRTLDTDGDGEIDPAEVSHYENEIAPEIRVREAGPGTRDGGGGRSSGGHGGRGGGGGRRGGGSGGGSSNSSSTTPHQSLGVEGAARYGLLDLPEPVTAADTDFNRSITAREFAAAAAARFEALDTDGDGYLTMAKLSRR